MRMEAQIQMISSVINSKGVARGEFFRVNEYLYVLRFGNCIASPLDLILNIPSIIVTESFPLIASSPLSSSGYRWHLW